MSRPKQRQSIADFSGGLVTFPSPLDMRENQFQQLDEVDNMKLGRLEKVKGSADDAAAYTNIDSGYLAGDNLKGQGLFTYRTEWDKAGTPVENSTNWFILYRKNGDSDRTLNRYDEADGTGGSWAEIFDETVWTSKTNDPNLDMVVQNEVLRVSDGNFANANNASQWYGYIKRSRFGNSVKLGGTSVSYNECERFAAPSPAEALSTWHRTSTDLTPPVMVSMKMAWDRHTEVDDSTVDVGLYIHYTGTSNILTDDVSEGTFSEGDLYTATYVYDYIQESALGRDDGGNIGVRSKEDVSGSGARCPGIQVVWNTATVDKRITGMNIYWNPKGDVDWYQIVHLDVNTGWADDYRAKKLSTPDQWFASSS